MSRPTSGKKPGRIIWRITERAPMGEWVDLDAPLERPVKTELPEVSSGGWITSSFDLLNGADVSDDPDTVPSALWDELFDPPKPAPKGSKT